MKDMLLDICNDVASRVWRLSTSSFHKLDKSGPFLIIPQTRDGAQRLSEQEARFLFCEELSRRGLYHSVETPTENEYAFSGNGKRSGQTDVTLWGPLDAGFAKKANIEFKSKSPKYGSIRKDIEKLIREPFYGCWFHLFLNANDATWKTTCSKIHKALDETFASQSRQPILFYFCVLKQRIAYAIEYKGANDIFCWPQAKDAWATIRPR